jgi:Na+-driven multidrug efflux pump
MFTSTICDGIETAACVLGSRLAAVAKKGGGGGGGAGQADEEREGNSRPSSNTAQNAARAKQAFLYLSRRLLLSGIGIGATYSLLMLVYREQIARFFTRDEGAIAFLLSGPAWPVVVAAQPLNSLVFISDGLIYAVRDFRGAFLSMALSFALGFLPALALFAGVVDKAGVFPIWIAKTVHNVGRLVGVSWCVWARHFRRW